MTSTATVAGADSAPDARTERWWAHEDWMAVWIGGVALLLILAGIRPSLPSLKWDTLGSLAGPLSPSVIAPWAIAGAVVWALLVPAVALQGAKVPRFTAGFAVVFGLAWLAQVLAAQVTAVAWGLEYVIFALVLGLIANYLTGVPDWLRHAVRTELFMKVGLVIMGATILLSDLLQAGMRGLLQAVAVVTAVWYVAFWIAKRFRLDDEFAVMLSSAVSICGVSAAIASCGAIQGDRRKLSHVTSIVLFVAIPMIVLQPWLAKAAGIPDVIAGAWLGGTLDTTGSVVAAGALVSEPAMKAATIVKFSQNVLIGVAAFLLSVWWSWRGTAAAASRPGVGVIWDRFPKFVLGFVAAVAIFSAFIDPDVVARTKGAVGAARTLWFSLGFVSIGLESGVGDLFAVEGGRPLASFVLAQVFNLAWTLLVAWLIFGVFGVF